MPPRAIKRQLTCPIEFTSGSSLIGGNGILVIPRNHLEGGALNRIWAVIKLFKVYLGAYSNHYGTLLFYPLFYIRMQTCFLYKVVSYCGNLLYTSFQLSLFNVFSKKNYKIKGWLEF